MDMQISIIYLYVGKVVVFFFRIHLVRLWYKSQRLTVLLMVNDYPCGLSESYLIGFIDTVVFSNINKASIVFRIHIHFENVLPLIGSESTNWLAHVTNFSLLLS
jgi:hypothetical protein